MMDRRQPANKERSNDADRSGTDRRLRERRSGEGSASALANLRKIEKDRLRTRLIEDDDSSN